MATEQDNVESLILEEISSQRADELNGERNDAFDNENDQSGDAKTKSYDGVLAAKSTLEDHTDVPGLFAVVLKRKRKKTSILYGVNDRPPWHTAILLGFQHFMTMFSTCASVPLLLAQELCIGNDLLLTSQLIGTTFFVSGLVTILQSTFGVRLPIIQGTTASFLSPTFAILALKGDCPPSITVNSTQEEISNSTEAFQIRIREIQGAVMVASCLQIFIGFTGITGWLLQFIGPITIAPTIALVGITLYRTAADQAGLHWGLAALTIALILGFSQYLPNVQIPCLGRDKVSGKWKWNKKFPVFKLFPIILGIFIAWLVAFIFTITNVFTNEPDKYGYYARTDLNSEGLKEAPWFKFPYPGQWGLPTLSIASVFGIMAGILPSIIESLGDYYACARLSEAPPPPAHAINRGVGVEGIGCFLAGAWGTANGTTSISQNIGAIGITKVGSRHVVQIAGCFMLVFGLVNKFSAVFTTLPDPIVGGVFCVMFGMITGVGLLNLQYADMNSTRNLCIVGFSFFMGLVLPYWIEENPDVISTGSRVIS